MLDFNLHNLRSSSITLRHSLLDEQQKPVKRARPSKKPEHPPKASKAINELVNENLIHVDSTAPTPHIDIASEMIRGRKMNE